MIFCEIRKPGIKGWQLIAVGLLAVVLMATGVDIQHKAEAGRQNEINPQLVELLENNNLKKIEVDKKDCVQAVVIMYHHIEEWEVAKKGGFEKLNVTPDYFRKHLKQLADNGYEYMTPYQLNLFFDLGIPLPKKAAMLTFDDAYEDNYRLAWPILKEFGAKAVIFVPTGLTGNPDYLGWKEIEEMSVEEMVYFGNHTWSHHSSNGLRGQIEKEIRTADNQLMKKGLNKDKLFAYPYGNPSKTAREALDSLGYKTAFTTRSGTRLCRSERMELPRVRAGNTLLNLTQTGEDGH